MHIIELKEGAEKARSRFLREKCIDKQLLFYIIEA